MAIHGPFKTLRHAALAACGIMLAATVWAGDFECRNVDANAPAHQLVFQQLADQLGVKPAALVYCAHDSYPRWIARWSPFEEVRYEGDVWRRYATARCMDRVEGVADCSITNHAFTDSSHVVIDIGRCSLDLSTVAQIREAVERLYPEHEINEIAFTTVTDGGAWSEEGYGFQVHLIEPPAFTGGSIRRMVRRCEGGVCAWQDGGGSGSWFGGSTELPRLRRTRNDPLIELLAP